MIYNHHKNPLNNSAMFIFVAVLYKSKNGYGSNFKGGRAKN